MIRNFRGPIFTKINPILNQAPLGSFAESRPFLAR
jgi:hypothetical protein